MKYFFHPAAKKELVDAVKYYNECGSGLGYIFMDEVVKNILVIAVMHLKREPDYWKSREEKS